MTMDLEAFYRRCPTTVQNFLCSIEGWRIGRVRYNGQFFKLLQEYESRKPEQLAEYRLSRLRQYLVHCGRNSPYFSQSFQSLRFNPAKLQSLDDLRVLPILTKPALKREIKEFTCRSVDTGEIKVAHTSGTTGSGLRFLTTQEALRHQWAVWWRYRRWHAIPWGVWCAYFGGRSIVPLDQQKPPFWRINAAGKQILFSAYHANRNNLKHYLDFLRLRKPPWFHGYPSALSFLASHMIDQGLDLGYNVRWVTVGAENLSNHQAGLIERAFGIKPRQHYGLAEGVANVSECDRGRLHIDEDFSAVEFIPAGAEGVFKIVGTSLVNMATAFIRYETGDIAVLSQEAAACSCGRPGRILQKIDGRDEDYVVLPNGAHVGRLDHIFKDLTNIAEAQIYQERLGRVVLRVARSRNYSDHDERQLLKEARQRLGADTEILIEYHRDRLERSSSAKLRFVVQRIPAR